MVRQYISDLECDEGGLPIMGKSITALTSTTYLVTSASTNVVSENANRRYLRIQNMGSWRVYLNCTSGTVALARGIRLNASNTDSSVFEIDSTKRYTGAVKGISATTGLRVSILQG